MTGGRVLTSGAGCCCLKVDWTGFRTIAERRVVGLRLGVVVVAGGDHHTLAVVGEAAGLSSTSTGPILMFPAKEGTNFLPPSLPVMILGILLSDTVLELTMSSAVLFLAPPRGPGQPSQPSWVSRRSPWQVG